MISRHGETALILEYCQDRSTSSLAATISSVRGSSAAINAIKRARKTPRLADVCDVRHISLRESRITTTPLFDCAQRSNRSQPYELALLLSPYGTGQD